MARRPTADLPARQSSRLTSLVTKIRACCTAAQEADSKQDAREKADLAFYQGEGQWDQGARDQRQAHQASAGMPAVPARPCLTINKTREPVRHVLNEERQADLGIELIPADDFEGLVGPIDASEIELREGLIRRIQRQSEAADARTWAFSRSTIAGRGVYGLMTRYVKNSSDQEIYYRRFFNQFQVKLDPAHEQPDGSDIEWATVGSFISWDRYKAEYPRLAGEDKDGAPNPLIDLNDAGFDGLMRDDPDWFVSEGARRMVRVLEYWYIEYAPRAADDNRHEATRTVKFTKTDGRHILEETDWPGEYIPIIKVVGEELHPFDGERRVEGMIRPARDPQIGFNYMVSAQVEAIGSAPKAPFQLDPLQIEGPYKQMWEQANVRNWPYLPRRSYDDNGRQFLNIERMHGEPPIQAITHSIAGFDQYIKSTTGVPDPTLGNVDPSIRSAKGIKALLSQAQQGSSHYLDNLIRSEHYEAKILNNLLPAIYGRPGRLVRIMTGENETQQVLLHQPFTMQGAGPQQRPQAVPGWEAGQPIPEGAKHYTLTPGADFNIAVKVSRNFDTRRQEQEATLGELVAAQPEMMLPFFADLLFKYSDAPGHQQLEKRGKLMLAPAVQASLAGQAEIPPQVQQKLQQMSQAGQALQAEVTRLTQIIQAKQVESDAKLKEAALDNASREKIALINASVGLEKTQATLDAENARTFVDAMENRLSKALELHMARLSQAHEAQQQQHAQAHEHASALELAQTQHAQALALGEQQHAQGLEAGDQGHQQALEQSAQAAALQPTTGAPA